MSAVNGVERIAAEQAGERANRDNEAQTQVRCARTFALWAIRTFAGGPEHYTQSRLIITAIRMFDAGRREAAIALMEHLLEYDDKHCTPAFDWPGQLHLIPDAMRLEHAMHSHWMATHWAYDSVCRCAFPAMASDDGAEVFLYDDPTYAHRAVRFSIGESDPETWFEDVWQWLVDKAHGRHAIPDSARAKGKS